MGSGGGGDTQTTVSKSEMPSWAAPHAMDLLSHAAESTFPRAQNPFPNQQVSPLNANQNLGLQMAQNRAIQGSPVMNAAQNNLTDTLNGKYLDPGSNPAWNPMVQRITDAYSTGTAAQTDAAAARANAFGSSGYNQQVGLNQRGLGDSLSAAAGDLYNQERGRQMQANLFAPQAAQADYQDAQALLGVGDTQRQYTQDVMNNQYTNAYQQANWPYQSLDIYGNALTRAVGGTSVGQQTGPNPYQPNKSANALGMAAAGAGTGAMVGGPYGAAIGGVAGGLYGLLA